MEARGQAPDYDICQVVAHIRPLLDAAQKSVVLYPAEVAPAGVRLDEWIQQVMSRKRTAT
jgi:hypothetical protein